MEFNSDGSRGPDSPADQDSTPRHPIRFRGVRDPRRRFLDSAKAAGVIEEFSVARSGQPQNNALPARVPEIDVRLVLSDRNLHLIDDHIDVAVRIGALADSNMVATRVGSVRSVVCGSPAYFAAHGEPKIPADLSDLACVTFGMLGSHGSWTFATPPSKAEQAVSIRSRLSVNTAEAALDACMAGVGVTRVLSYQAARGVEEGTLKIVLTDFEGDPLPVSLVQAGWGRVPLKTRTFLDMAVPGLRSALALPPGG